MLVLMLGFGAYLLLIQIVQIGGTPQFLVELAVVIGAVTLVGLLHLFRPGDWWLIPGAIVVRTAGWRGTEWKLHRFTQADSVVIYWVDLNQLAVANAAGQAFSRDATRIEAETALRAWLSPVPPPPREQLSDLT